MPSEDEEIRSLKIIVKGAGIIFIGMIASKILAYLYRVFIARYFGPEDYGLFALGLAIIGFAGIFARLGVHSGVVRYVPYYKAKGDDARVKGTITSALKITAPASIFMAMLLFLLSGEIATKVFHNPELSNVLKIMSLSIPFFSLFRVFELAFVGFQKIKYQVYTDHIFSNVTKLIFVIFFGILGYGVYSIAWSWTIAAILTFFLSMYFLEKKVYPIFKTPVKSIYLKRELLSFSLPLVFAGFMGVIIVSTDTVMLGYFKTVKDVGIYNAAMPTAQILNIIPGALATLFLPIITGLYSRQKINELKKVYRTVFKWIFYLNLPLFLLMIFFSKQVLNILFGTEYIVGYMALTFLSLGVFTLGLSIPLSNILSMLKKTRHILYISIVSAFANFFMNLLLIPPYGIEGAAIASATTYVINVILLLWISWYFIRATPLSFTLMKSISAGIISMFFVNFVGRLVFESFTAYILIPLFLSFLVLYGLLLLVFKGLEREDIEILKAIEAKSGIRLEFLRNVIKKFI